MINATGGNSFTDTLGVTALTISGSSPRTFTYPVTLQSDSATTASTTLSYKQYTVRTNFQCSGIVEYGSTSVNLVDRITLPDSTYYAFTYEPTPSATDGAVTARVASITLPTGGTISYKYTAGCSGAGINPDGTTGSLTRTTSDGTKSYNRAPVNANATSTTVTDEKNNVSVYQFTEDAGSSQFYETHRQIYQGSQNSGNAPLLDQYTCYNGATPNCDGQSMALPILSTTVVSSFNSGSQLTTDNAYNSSGLLTSSFLFNGSTQLLSHVFTYNAFGEVVSSGSGDGSNDEFSSTTYGYDETTGTGHAPVQATSSIPQHTAPAAGTPTGNLTSINVSTGSSTVTTAMKYYDTGVPVATTDSDGGVITYSYDSTQTFTTQTTLPTPSSGVAMSTSAQYDQQSTAPTSITGANAGQTTKVTAYDRFLRPQTVTFPDGGSTSYTYTANQIGVKQVMTSPTSSDTETLYDGYGRVSRIAVANGQSTNPWYQTDYCYDATGLLQFQTVPYQGTGFSSAKQCTGAGATYLYDGLGRLTSTQTADGTATNTYLNRAVETTDVNGVKRITQYDLLGETIAVCEISSNSSMPGSGSPVSCGTDIAGTGFVTSYSYTPFVNHKTTVTQGSQTRTFTTDSAGRTIDVVEPERGETTYSYTYNSTGLILTRTRPQANQTGTATTTTTTQYDLLGRVVSVKYNDNLTPNRQFDYDQVNSQMQWQQSPTNLKGLLTDTASGSGSTLTRDLFSYDLMGRVTNIWQCAPSICGTSAQASRSAITSSYDLAGNLNGESAVTAGAISYGLSPAGEVTSITNSSYTVSGSTPPVGSPAPLVSNVANGPYGPISYALGNGLNTIKSYDSMGRANGGWVCNGSSKTSCTGGTQIYGNIATWQGSRMTAQCDTALNICLSLQYDEFNRLTQRTVSQGTAQNFTYTYDRYGNRWNQTVTSGSGPSPGYSFNVSTNQIVGMSYDAAGNIRGDGVHSYTYDAEGNILNVDNGSTAQYVYDALNRRVRTQTSSTAYEYLYDSLGQRTSRWIVSNNFGDSGRIFSNGQQVAFRGSSGQTFLEHQDILGTERARTNYQGKMAVTSVSLPFGDGFSDNVLLTGGDQDDSYYTGMDKDLESSTDHGQFRQYSNTQGRWMSPDPYDGSYRIWNPQSLNRYSYVLNSPLSLVDPLGLDDSYVCFTDDTDCGDGGGGGGDGGGGGCPGGADACVTGNPDPPPPTISGDPTDYIGQAGGGGGAGGSGGAPNNCPAGPANVYNFIHANQAGANALSQQSGVNADYLLGLSGWESQWGANRFAQQGNNFFSLHGGSSAPFANGSMKAGGANVYLSTFPSYFASGQSFLAQYGNGLAGANSPAAFGQQLINNHFNSGNAATGGNSNFLSNTVTGINMVIRRKGC